MWILTVILLLALLSAGLIFVLSYNGRLSGSTFEPLNFNSVSIQTFLAFLFSFPINFAWLGLIIGISQISPLAEPAVDAAVQIVATSFSDFAVNQELLRTAIIPYKLQIAFYFMGLFIFSFTFGGIARKLVRLTQVDLRISFLRFNQEWFYWLSGEIANCADNEYQNIRTEKLDKLLYVLTDVGASSTIYIGMLIDYTIDHKGSLEKILLAYPLKTAFLPDENTLNNAIPLDSDFLAIDQRSIRNIGIKLLRATSD